MFLHDKFSSLCATCVNSFPRNVSLTPVLHTSPIVCRWSRVLLGNYCTKDIPWLYLPLIWETTTCCYSCVPKDTEKILVQRQYVILFYNAYTLFGYSLWTEVNSESNTLWHMKVCSTEVYLQSYSFPGLFLLINEQRRPSGAQQVSNSLRVPALHPFSDACIMYWTRKIYFGQTLYFDF